MIEGSGLRVECSGVMVQVAIAVFVVFWVQGLGLGGEGSGVGLFGLKFRISRSEITAVVVAGVPESERLD